jgi:hypothetical protein
MPYLMAVARVAVLAFALHLSGAAHVLADVLFDDDLTCVDELAHDAQRKSPAPRCPASQGIGQGYEVAAPHAIETWVAPAVADRVAGVRQTDLEPPSVPRRAIERPPRG